MKADRHKKHSFLKYIAQPALVFTKTGAIVDCNRALSSIAAQPADALIGAHIDAVVADAHVIHEAIKRMNNECDAIEVKQLRLHTNTILQNVAIASNGTEYLLIADEQNDDLEKHHELFKSIIDSIPRHVALIDADGNVLIANKQWKKLFAGICRQSMKGMDYSSTNYFDLCSQARGYDDSFYDLLYKSVGQVISNTQETIALENKMKIDGVEHVFRHVMSRYVLGGTACCMVVLIDITEQKLYQLQLQEQRDTFQKYLDIAPYMIVVLNTMGVITLVNNKTCQLLGYSHNELVGNTWVDLCLPDEAKEDVRNVIVKLNKGQQKLAEFYENPVITKSGQMKLISWHNTLLTDAEGVIMGTMSSGEDITVQKQMEFELLKSTTNLKAIVKAFPDLYIIVDRAGVVYDYQFGEEMKLYLTKEEVIGRPFYDILPEHVSELYNNALQQALETNSVTGVEYPIEIQGETRWREARLVPMMKDRVLAVIRDVTQRKTAELALMQSEKRYRHLVNRIPAAVVEMNIHGDILFVNDYFIKLTGYTLENLHKTHWFRSLLHPHEDKSKLREFIHMIRHGDVTNFEIRIINKSGKDSYITITTSNVYNSVGKLEKIICMASDSTQIITMREQLKEMAIKDELTGLYNRRGFMMLAEQQLKVAKRTGSASALFYIDMDNMKMINDTLGHHEGDKALIDVSGSLRLSFRDSDIIGRVGGDEFAVLAVNCAKHDVDMMQVRLADNLQEYNEKNIRSYKLSVSTGSVFISDSSLRMNEIIAAADSRMYQDKLKKKKIQQ